MHKPKRVVELAATAPRHVDEDALAICPRALLLVNYLHLDVVTREGGVLTAGATVPRSKMKPR